MTITWTDQNGNQSTLTFPQSAPGQTAWFLSVSNGQPNRFIEGETFIARDYFPVRVDIPPAEQIP